MRVATLAVLACSLDTVLCSTGQIPAWYVTDEANADEWLRTRANEEQCGWYPGPRR